MPVELFYRRFMQRFPEYSLVQRAAESGVSDTRARLSAQSNRPIDAAEQQRGSAAAKLTRRTDLQEHDPMHHLLQAEVTFAANSATAQATKAVLLTSNQLIIR